MSKAFEEREMNALIWVRFVEINMAAWKAGLSALIGLLLIGSFVGYTYEEDFEGIPKPDAGVCGVTKDSFDQVPGDGALVDIDVTITWDDDTIWIGIIDVDTYENLVDIGGNSDGKMVACDSDITYLAGGPSIGNNSNFEWIPNGEEFHIIMGSLEEGDGDDSGDDGNPWPFSNGVDSQSFTGEFNVHVEGDASGGWGIILILLLIEIGAVWNTLLDR